MATETTFWGYVFMYSKHSASIKKYLDNESYSNKVIDKESLLIGSSRGITLTFGKTVRGGFEEKDFWVNEFEFFLKNIVAMTASICFEFEDKPGVYIYNYVCDGDKSEWRAFENYFIWQDTNERLLDIQ
jgi:hypothetical protein